MIEELTMQLSGLGAPASDAGVFDWAISIVHAGVLDLIRLLVVLVVRLTGPLIRPFAVAAALMLVTTVVARPALPMSPWGDETPDA
jgi:hypothetical protein